MAASTVGRFAINSLFGLAGIADRAARGLPLHENGFGTTLGRCGVEPGPYLFLPLVGPRTVRDSVGGLADLGLDPLSYVHYSGQTAVGVSTAVVDTIIDRIDAERDLATIEETSTDPYATIRSFYLQNRRQEISGDAGQARKLAGHRRAGRRRSVAPGPDARTLPAEAHPTARGLRPVSDRLAPPPAPTAEPGPSAPCSELRGATVLVTGATGFVGSAVARALQRRGAQLRLLVRPSSPRPTWTASTAR